MVMYDIYYPSMKFEKHILLKLCKKKQKSRIRNIAQILRIIYVAHVL